MLIFIIISNGYLKKIEFVNCKFTHEERDKKRGLQSDTLQKALQKRKRKEFTNLFFFIIYIHC